MPEEFDAYHKWLGIAPKDQPPHHYRLLGIDLFEADGDVIASAADQRMAHVRSFQAGRHSDLSQKILNQIAAARVCLLDPKKKAHYNRQLRKQLSPPSVSPAAASPPATPSPPAAPSSPAAWRLWNWVSRRLRLSRRKAAGVRQARASPKLWAIVSATMI